MGIDVVVTQRHVVNVQSNKLKKADVGKTRDIKHYLLMLWATDDPNPISYYTDSYCFGQNYAGPLTQQHGPFFR